MAAWTLVMLGITIRLLATHHVAKHTVYPPYIGAAHHWIAGEDLYGPDCLDFRYSPLFAAAFTPFTALPDRIGSVAWRLLILAIYLPALGWWLRTVLRGAASAKRRGVFLLLAIPLSIGSLNNGQANLPMTALMLGALACVDARRWMLAGALLALAVHLKLYPLALALVLAAMWPRELSWRQPLMLAASVALTFALQAPRYVAAQFAGWFGHLSGDLRLDQTPEAAYRDLRLLLDAIGLPPGHLTYFIIQLAGAAAVAVACIAMKKSAMPRRRLNALVYALVACWILLLGPATESATYVVLAPALAWLLVEAWTAPRPLAERAALVAVCVLLAAAMMANWLPTVRKIHALGLHPLAVVVFLGCVVYEAFAPSLRRAEIEAPGGV